LDVSLCVFKPIHVVQGVHIIVVSLRLGCGIH
jgi:hypothetical protein